jgi:hypothetical protein
MNSLRLAQGLALRCAPRRSNAFGQTHSNPPHAPLEGGGGVRGGTPCCLQARTRGGGQRRALHPCGTRPPAGTAGGPPPGVHAAARAPRRRPLAAGAIPPRRQDRLQFDRRISNNAPVEGTENPLSFFTYNPTAITPWPHAAPPGQCTWTNEKGGRQGGGQGAPLAQNMGPGRRGSGRRPAGRRAARARGPAHDTGRRG